MPSSAPTFLTVYEALRETYGPQHWWPGETVFEVMAGAVLTQNTNWRNASLAIANLAHEERLSPERLLRTDLAKLETLLKPSGYFRIKAQRLRNLCEWIIASGGLTQLSGQPTPALRQSLLQISGVGPETADAILLYAFERAVFVVDAYTFRLFKRLGLLDDNRLSYEALRALLEGELGEDVPLFNEYHALIVIHCKETCRPKPRCDECALAAQCAYAMKE